MKRRYEALEALSALKVGTGVHYEMTCGMGGLLRAFDVFCDSGVETLPECGENPKEWTKQLPI
jgi:hypothetical protein